MTSSSPLPGDDASPGQEEIWDDAPANDDAAGGPRREAPPPARDRGGLAASLTSTARTPGPAGLFYADVPDRIIAMFIDFIALALVGFVLAMLFGGMVSDPGSFESAGGELELLPFLVVLAFVLAISFGYFGYSWTTVRATPGMRLLGLRIGDESDGHAIEWRQAAIRWLLIGVPATLGTLGAYVPSLVGVVLALIGLAWLGALLYTVAQSPTRQGLHDRYAHTIVVDSPRRRG